MQRLLAAVRSSVYGSAFVVLWFWFARWATRFDGVLGLRIPLWLELVGVVVAIGGAVLAVACVVAFFTVGRGTPAPFDPPREFVAVGPYRYVRNPMYLGGFSVLLGAGLYLSSPGVLCVALVFLVFFHLFVRFYEEPTLEARFGESYRLYRERVRRWWPGSG